MPMPSPHSSWPLPGTAGPNGAQREWAAWWANDTGALHRLYGKPDTRPRDVPAQHRGGVVGKAARWFWGEPTPPGQRNTKLHVPAAADLCATAGDLLFAEPPALRVDQGRADAGPEATAVQDRLDVMLGEHASSTLRTGGEYAAALGGVYLRAGWDRDVADHPLLTTVQADSAVPRFSYGRLVEVTFHREVERDEARDRIVRHLEHHEMAGGQCVIRHALYEGRRDNLGHLVPLDEHPSTAHLVGSLTDGDLIATGLPRLDVAYVPNRLHPAWRHDPYAQHLGGSVLAGSEPLLDALDETWSSWMRDIRLGKGRLVVPGYYLETAGKGQGAMFDEDREVYATVNREPSSAGSGLALSAHQFAIRFEEHQNTAAALWEAIVTNGARYSAQTFGLSGEAAMTASESYARERKTHGTRGGQLRAWRIALVDIAEALQWIDRTQFGARYTPVRPDVEWPPMFEEQPGTRAQTVSMLASAEAASLEVRVAMVHPEWDQDQVAEEVTRIRGEAPPAPGFLE